MPTLTSFTTKQLEMMCELELDPTQPGYAHAKAIQAKIALKLARLYHTDTHFGANPNKVHASYKHWLKRKHSIVQSREKAEKYAKLAGIRLPPLTIEQAEQEDVEGFAIMAKIKNALSWFTSIRLFLLRANRVASRFKDAFIPRISRISPALKFVPRIFPILSLSYLFEAIFGSVEILKATQKPLSDHEIGMPNWRRNLQRIYNAAINVPTLSYMANAIVWFPINLISIKFTGGLFFVIANLAGFSFDVVNEAFKGSDTLWHGFRGLSKITKLIKTPNKNAEKDQAWRLLHGALKKDVRSTFWQTTYAVIMTVAIVAGMGMIFVPHTMPIGVGLLGGSILALGGGSVFLGFGKRVAMATLNFTKTHLLGMSNKKSTVENKLRARAKLAEEPSIFAAFTTHAQLQQSMSQQHKRTLVQIPKRTKVSLRPTFMLPTHAMKATQTSTHKLFPTLKRTAPLCTKVASIGPISARRTQS